VTSSNRIQSTGPLALIRTRTAAVAARARSVRIDETRLHSFARELPTESPPPSGLDPAHHFGEDPHEKLAYVVTLGAVNFGSGWFPHLRKRPGCSGYFTIAHALEDRFRQFGPWSAAELAELTARDCAGVFGQDLAIPEMAELMECFSGSLSQLGAHLVARYCGSFESLIEAADRSCERLVELLSAMSFYRDISEYRGLEVPFYKRAQLTAADLSLAFEGESHGEFRDLDRLTLFADNLVPHVLRFEGVLRYDPELARRIDRGELLEHGSMEEVEIRAVALQAVERMVDLLCGSDSAQREINARVLDYWLWFRGQRPAIKKVPRHRSRTTAY